MTQIDIAALEADREAGTKGPWVVHEEPEEQIDICAADRHVGRFVPIMSRGMGYNDNVDNESRANARRIARVPDMEAALIAQDAELKRLREALTEAKETLVEVKRDMWREAAPRWIMADFLNWAIVQRITASIASARAALGEKP